MLNLTGWDRQRNWWKCWHYPAARQLFVNIFMFLIGTASSIIIQPGWRSLRSAICAFMRYSRASSPWLYAIPYMFGHIGQSFMLKYIFNPFLGNLHIVVDPCGIPLLYGGAISAYKCRNRWYCHKCLILSYPFFDGFGAILWFVFMTLCW